jgi:putative ABC transport system permease protein
MGLLDAIRLALSQLRVQKLKSFFTLLGVTIGVMFLIAVVSIVEGMGRYLRDELVRQMGVNTFTLNSYARYTGEVSDAVRRRGLRNPPLLLADVEAVVDALPAGTRWFIRAGGSRYAALSAYAPERQVEVQAVEGDFFTIKGYDLSLGRAISGPESEYGAPVLVIGDQVAKHFFPNLDPIGRELRIGNTKYEVVGVIEAQGSFFGQSLDELAIAPYRSPLGRLVNRRGVVNGITVQAASPLALREAEEAVREVMRGRRALRPTHPDNFSFSSSDDDMAEFNKVMAIATLAGSVLPAIGLIVGGIVIMNIMLVAVAERTHEIGIRKSLGARRKDILRQFLVESATLSTLGAIVGIALGIAGAEIIAWKTPLPAAVAPWSIVAATLLGTVVGIVAGVYPASRAARLDPIAALRQE